MNTIIEDYAPCKAELSEKLRKAIAVAETGDSNNAQLILSDIIQFSHIDTVSEIVLQAYIHKAKLFLQTKELELVSSTISDGLKRYPDAEMLMVLHAQYFESTGNYQQAIVGWENILKLFPKEKTGYIQSGNCYLMMDRLEDAEKILDSGSKLFPNELYIMVGLAQVYRRANSMERAYAQWERVQHQFPEFLPANTHLANILLETRQLDKAEALFKHIKQQFPDEPIGYEGLNTIAEIKTKLTVEPVSNSDKPSHPDNVLECVLCGETYFESRKVLWEELVKSWNLSEYETTYINKQQGLSCYKCKTNMRSMALAKAMMRVSRFDGLFVEYIEQKAVNDLLILELNTAGGLHPYLKHLSNHQLGEYPSVDMMDMKFGDSTFDMVVHSDTLEHVPDPAQGLRECHRVLKTKGSLLFTVPIVVDRTTKSREGLPLSFHGSPEDKGLDLVVHTEYGADIWKSVIEAGFDNCSFVTLGYPNAIAVVATKY